MSVLETPRILFRGLMSWDPITTNNYPAYYDEATAEPLPPGDSVRAFRKAAIEAVVPQRNWNPHGTHRSTFYDTFVTGADLPGGRAADDPFLGVPVAFTGMLVDSEPYGALSSQLFFDSMSFGIEGGCRLFAPRTTRVMDRYINFGRNPANAYIAGVASVVWQTSFPKEGLVIDVHDSAALAALLEALDGDEDVQGLTVRWTTYFTLYYGSDNLLANTELSRQLAARLRGGGFQPNPARSRLVGAIGLWRKGEPPHEPGDRALIYTGGPIASAHARIDGASLTLDLSNSVSEVDMALTKQDLGELSVVAVEADGTTVAATLGSFGYDRYDRAAYERDSGLVTLAIDPGAAEAAAALDLQLRGADGTVYLKERALRAIPADPNLYLDEGETVTSEVRLLDRGRPAGAGREVRLALVGASAGAASVQPTDGDGIARFPFAGTGGQVETYVLLADDSLPVPTNIANALDPQVYTYMTVRTLAADQATAQLPATWDNVYAKVLSNWHAMAPCMDNWLHLDDEAQVRAYKDVLARLTAKESFESFRFMPVTRDMTAGERTLLYRFLGIDAGDGAGKGLLAAAAPADVAIVSLSEQMRNK